MGNTASYVITYLWPERNIPRTLPEVTENEETAAVEEKPANRDLLAPSSKTLSSPSWDPKREKNPAYKALNGH